MQHPIAQTVALVCHANALLRGKGGGPLFPGNSTMQFCEWVRFVALRGRLLRPAAEEPVAPGPDEWMEGLRAASAQRLRLARKPTAGSHRPEYDLAAFSGGGAGFWILVEGAAGATSAWASRWMLGDREAADRRIWRVTYGRLKPPRSLRPSADLADRRERLERSLEAILDFSLRRSRGYFREAFEQALRTLRTGERRGFHRDLAPEGALPEPAAALLDACQSAWVFGGMGWWSDQWFEGAEAAEYARVTAEHYESVCEAIAAGANATAG